MDKYFFGDSSNLLNDENHEIFYISDSWLSLDVEPSESKLEYFSQFEPVYKKMCLRDPDGIAW